MNRPGLLQSATMLLRRRADVLLATITPSPASASMSADIRRFKASSSGTFSWTKSAALSASGR
jgi:hypothetical protein